MPATYDKINSNTLSTSASSITFSSIPSTYTDLIVVCSYIVSSAGQVVTYQFNSDTATNYSYTSVGGFGSSTSSKRGSNVSYNTTGIDTGAVTSGEFAISNIYIMNYNNTNVNKTSLVRAGLTGGSYPGTETLINLWRSTSAITSIVLKAGNGAVNFNSGSTFALYGIKAA